MVKKPNQNDKIFCEKCGKMQKRANFYKSNNTEKYPDGGTIPICKKCMTMHVDNWDPSTYLWILQEADVPYVPKEWDKLLVKYGQDKSQVNGLSIIGRYLALMKLNQYKKYRWKDSDALRQVMEKEIAESLERQGKSQTEIDQIIESQRIDIPTEPIEVPNLTPGPKQDELDNFAVMPVDFTQSEPEEDSSELGLTDDDVRYLRLRWGKAYKPSEWIAMERFYRDFEATYDIQTAGHRDTLKKLAKVSLKLDQLIDLGDIEGAQKAEKMYDNLMKSGSFTAHQNKEETSKGIDSVGEIVAICESKDFIPRYYVDGPKDKVDRVIQDLQEYTRSLILEETNIGELIDNAVKQIEIEKARADAAGDEDISDEEALEQSLFSEDKNYLNDNSFTEFSNFEEGLEELDLETMSAELEKI